MEGNRWNFENFYCSWLKNTTHYLNIRIKQTLGMLWIWLRQLTVSARAVAHEVSHRGDAGSIPRKSSESATRSSPTTSIMSSHFHSIIPICRISRRRSQVWRGLRRRSAVARLLRLCVRIPPAVWIFVCCDCCVLSGRGLWDGLITRPEESYRLWCVVVCDLENSRMRRPWPTWGLWRQKRTNKQT